MAFELSSFRLYERSLWTCADETAAANRRRRRNPCSSPGPATLSLRACAGCCTILAAFKIVAFIVAYRAAVGTAGCMGLALATSSAAWASMINGSLPADTVFRLAFDADNTSITAAYATLSMPAEYIDGNASTLPAPPLWLWSASARTNGSSALGPAGWMPWWPPSTNSSGAGTAVNVTAAPDWPVDPALMPMVDKQRRLPAATPLPRFGSDADADAYAASLAPQLSWPASLASIAASDATFSPDYLWSAKREGVTMGQRARTAHGFPVLNMSVPIFCSEVQPALAALPLWLQLLIVDVDALVVNAVQQAMPTRPSLLASASSGEVWDWRSPANDASQRGLRIRPSLDAIPVPAAAAVTADAAGGASQVVDPAPIFLAPSFRVGGPAFLRFLVGAWDRVGALVVALIAWFLASTGAAQMLRAFFLHGAAGIFALLSVVDVVSHRFRLGADGGRMPTTEQEAEQFYADEDSCLPCACCPQQPLPARRRRFICARVCCRGLLFLTCCPCCDLVSPTWTPLRQQPEPEGPPAAARQAAAPRGGAVAAAAAQGAAAAVVGDGAAAPVLTAGAAAAPVEDAAAAGGDAGEAGAGNAAAAPAAVPANAGDNGAAGAPGDADANGAAGAADALLVFPALEYAWETAAAVYPWIGLPLQQQRAEADREEVGLRVRRRGRNDPLPAPAPAAAAGALAGGAANPLAAAPAGAAAGPGGPALGVVAAATGGAAAAAAAGGERDRNALLAGGAEGVAGAAADAEAELDADHDAAVIDMRPLGDPAAVAPAAQAPQQHAPGLQQRQRQRLFDGAAAANGGLIRRLIAGLPPRQALGPASWRESTRAQTAFLCAHAQAGFLSLLLYVCLVTVLGPALLEWKSHPAGLSTAVFGAVLLAEYGSLIFARTVASMLLLSRVNALFFVAVLLVWAATPYPPLGWLLAAWIESIIALQLWAMVVFEVPAMAAGKVSAATPREMMMVEGAGRDGRAVVTAAAADAAAWAPDGSGWSAMTGWPQAWTLHMPLTTRLRPAGAGGQAARTVYDAPLPPPPHAIAAAVAPAAVVPDAAAIRPGPPVLPPE